MLGADGDKVRGSPTRNPTREHGPRQCNIYFYIVPFDSSGIICYAMKHREKLVIIPNKKK